MPGSRLPLALEVFPTLKGFPALRPRRILQVPVGCTNRNLKSELAQRSLQHLYHDLGVLVFAGSTPAQVKRIGDVLREVVRRGGPGGVVTELSRAGTRTKTRRDAALSKSELYETLDATRAGVIKPETLLRLASARLRELLQAQVAESDNDPKKIHIREAQVLLPGSPQPRGTVLQTVNGPRRLPIQSFASISISSENGRTSGEVQFYAAGTGEYVGGAKIDYVLLRYDHASKAVKPFWGHGTIDKRHKVDKERQREAVDEVLESSLGPLWELEREVWAQRAEQLEEHRMQT